MNFWASCDVKFTHVPGLQRCTAATFILRIGLWNQCICAHNVFSGCGEKFMLTFNSGKSSLNFKTTFRNFEGMFNLWPGFQPRSTCNSNTGLSLINEFHVAFPASRQESNSGISWATPTAPALHMNEGLISGGTAGWERAEVGGGGGGGGASVAVPSTVIILLISILRFLHAIDGSSSLKKMAEGSLRRAPSRCHEEKCAATARNPTPSITHGVWGVWPMGSLQIQ